jgi:hypothetical protein
MEAKISTAAPDGLLISIEGIYVDTWQDAIKLLERVDKALRGKAGKNEN